MFRIFGHSNFVIVWLLDFVIWNLPTRSDYHFPTFYSIKREGTGVLLPVLVTWPPSERSEAAVRSVTQVTDQRQNNHHST